MEVVPLQMQTTTEQMRDLILSIDFESLSEEPEEGFDFDEW